MVQQRSHMPLVLDIAKRLRHQLPAPGWAQMMRGLQEMPHQVELALLNLGDVKTRKLGQRHPRCVSNLQRSAFP
jgi:hypothetical protein